MADEDNKEHPTHLDILMAETYKSTQPQYEAAECQHMYITIACDANEPIAMCERNPYSTTEISDEVPVKQSEPQPHADALTCEANVTFRTPLHAFSPTRSFHNRRSWEDSAGLADALDEVGSQSSPEQQDTIRVADDAPQENEARKVAKQKRCMSIKFLQVIETAEKDLNSAEEGLKVLYDAKSISTPGPTEEVDSRVRHMEETLATASVQVASLLAANYCDKLDYIAATEPIIALTKSVRSVIDDGSVISTTLYERACKSFIEDMQGLCEATKDIYEAARSNNEKLNEAAVAFGNQSAKLLGVFSFDDNTTLEMELISRAKAVNETACHLIQEVSNIANNANNKGDSQDISTATERCVDAAEKLVYTAKLVAPTIQYSTCQDALVSSADSLSTTMTTLLNIWKAFTPAQRPNIRKLTQVGENLEALVENLRNDVKTGTFGNRVQEDRFVTRDVPLIHVAKQIAVCYKADAIRVNTEPTHLDILLGETNDTFRPRYQMLCKSSDIEVTRITPAIPKVGILNEKNTDDDMVDCVKPEDKMTLEFNGQQVEVLKESTEKHEDSSRYKVEKEFDTASKWLSKFNSKAEVKTNGQQAVRNLIAVANKITEDRNGYDRDMRHLITETEQVLAECTKKYDHNQYSVLMERVRELKKGIEQGVVTRVVEDFMEADTLLADLDIILTDRERGDERKRKFLLEKKIAELLAHLSRVTKTARLIAHTDSDTRDTVSTQLDTCSEQADLLASMLVEAAQQRATFPDDTVVINKYKSLLARYAELLSKIRDLCDQSVDPMDFVQTADETMRRIREESLIHKDPLMCAHSSSAIAKLGHRVIHVSMSSSTARSDPELQKALLEAQQQMITATSPADFWATSESNWQHTTAQILRTTAEVEALLSGETIFKEQPETHQPIYNEALNLHEAVRDWSSRDNEIIAVAKRMAVLMAKLSNFMNIDKQREVLATSKSIVAESHEVVRLAKKLAHECPDRRIKTNLLQSCERIPTVSAQLKMLTTVKATSLGRYGIREDKDAMDMLVGNAQSLMLSIQYVVKGAAGASVKIMSQRGLRMKWVRKTMC